MTNVDPKAVKILFNAFSSKALAGRSVESVARDFEYAKSQGVMFDNLVLNHDAIVSRALSAVKNIQRQDVANAFVSSLASRRLDLRSALGSFAVLQHFPAHLAPVPTSACPICGVYNRETLKELNCLNLERLQYGGVRHDEPLYAALDLELFAKLEPVIPLDDDIQLLRMLLHAFENAPSRTTSAQLERFVPKQILSNKNERAILIGILGLCGILCTQEHAGYLKRFIQYHERVIPSRRFVDMAYPACWWSSLEGIRNEAVLYWFGHLLG